MTNGQEKSANGRIITRKESLSNHLIAQPKQSHILNGKGLMGMQHISATSATIGIQAAQNKSKASIQPALPIFISQDALQANRQQAYFRFQRAFFGSFKASCGMAAYNVALPSFLRPAPFLAPPRCSIAFSIQCPQRSCPCHKQDRQDLKCTRLRSSWPLTWWWGKN